MRFGTTTLNRLREYFPGLRKVSDEILNARLDPNRLNARALTAPPRASPLPPPGQRGHTRAGTVGVLFPVYSAVSRDLDLGHGTMTRLGEFGRRFADFGVSILYHLPNGPNGTGTGDVSPYGGTSDFGISANGLSFAFLPEFAEALERDPNLFSDAELADLERARGEPLINYSVALPLIEKALNACYDAFEVNHLGGGTARGAAFDRFVALRQEGFVERDAMFFALSRVHGEDWRTWPAEVNSLANAQGYLDSLRERAGSDPGAAGQLRALERGVNLYKWSQFAATQQWMGDLVEPGLAQGLVQWGDKPISVNILSAAAWGNPEYFDTRTTLGTPPNDGGQRWGLPPPNYARMREDDPPYLYLRKQIRDFRFYYPDGKVRLDHALGLFRFYVYRPDGDGFDVKDPAEQDRRFREILQVFREEGVEPVLEDLGRYSRTENASSPEQREQENKSINDQFAASGERRYAVAPWAELPRGPDGRVEVPPSVLDALFPERESKVANSTIHDCDNLDNEWRSAYGKGPAQAGLLSALVAEGWKRLWDTMDPAQQHYINTDLNRVIERQASLAGTSWTPVDMGQLTAEWIGRDVNPVVRTAIFGALLGSQAKEVIFSATDLAWKGLPRHNSPGTPGGADGQNWRSKIGIEPEDFGHTDNTFLMHNILQTLIHASGRARAGSSEVSGSASA